ADERHSAGHAHRALREQGPAARPFARRRRLPLQARQPRHAALGRRPAAAPEQLSADMETVATIVYARLRNVLPAANAMPPEHAAAFVDELRGVLTGPIAKQRGVIAQQRADSILAVFANDPDDSRPDHARRALHAATLAAYETAGLNQRIAARLRQPLPQHLPL